MKRVIWTPTARKSLLRTADFLNELWNEDVADDFLNQLDFRIKQIQENPELASSFRVSEIRQLIIHKTVSLFYRNTPEYIKLLLIWDNRQDPSQLFKKLTDTDNS